MRNNMSPADTDVVPFCVGSSSQLCRAPSQNESSTGLATVIICELSCTKGNRWFDADPLRAEPQPMDEAACRARRAVNWIWIRTTSAPAATAAVHAHAGGRAPPLKWRPVPPNPWLMHSNPSKRPDPLRDRRGVSSRRVRGHPPGCGCCGCRPRARTSHRFRRRASSCCRPTAGTLVCVCIRMQS
jgi:hypothetical protein